MTDKPAISAFVITYNEQDMLPACLGSIDWVDEIVVVDSHSEDATVEVARRYTQRVIEHEFESYTPQTRYAFGQTTGEWVLWLDADERLSDRARQELRAELSGEPDCQGFSFPRKTYFMDRWITHSGWYPQHKTRVCRRSAGRIAGSGGHPEMLVEGCVKRLSGDILHNSYPGGIMEMARRSACFARMGADERYARGRRFRPTRLLARPPLEFLKKYFLQLGFLDGFPGFAIATASAYYRFLREVRLWELEHGKQPEWPQPPAR
ncbi:MAG: glycosyltransferase family 2 protein [Candidatus Brocadiia bacterium]